MVAVITINRLERAQQRGKRGANILSFVQQKDCSKCFLKLRSISDAANLRRIISGFPCQGTPKSCSQHHRLEGEYCAG
jgi:hypothetical protein